jgi:hypothetical protein
MIRRPIEATAGASAPMSVAVRANRLSKDDKWSWPSGDIGGLCKSSRVPGVAFMTLQYGR